MKKFLAIFLSSVLLTGLCAMTVLADFSIGGTTGYGETELVDPNNKTSAGGDVQINVNGVVTHKYAIDVTFGTLQFSYGAQSVWDPETHTYVISDGAEWVCVGNNTIRIENHSDLPIVYDATYSELNSLYGANLTLTLTKATGEIAACPVGAPNGVPSANVTVAVSGTPQGLTQDWITLSVITVTVGPKS